MRPTTPPAAKPAAAPAAFSPLLGPFSYWSTPTAPPTAPTASGMIRVVSLQAIVCRCVPTQPPAPSTSSTATAVCRFDMRTPPTVRLPPDSRIVSSPPSHDARRRRWASCIRRGDPAASPRKAVLEQRHARRGENDGNRLVDHFEEETLERERMPLDAERHPEAPAEGERIGRRRQGLYADHVEGEHINGSRDAHRHAG